jgi:hypothetical protein
VNIITSTGEMNALFRPLGRGLNVLTLARKFGMVRILMHHVPRSAATGRENVLFDGRRDQVFGRGRIVVRIDVPCLESTVSHLLESKMETKGSIPIPAPPRP